MLLRSIEFHDFRVFKGKQKIDFTKKKEDDGNAFIILGRNTFGKSTIIQSFIWCFYGDSKFANPNDLLNRDVANALRPGESATARVTVVFDDEGKTYTISRAITYKNEGTKLTPDKVTRDKTVLSMSYVSETGQTEQIGKVQLDRESAIRAMLPQDLSSFFFFEGEKNNDIENKDLSESVKNLVGLSAMAKMKEHLYGTNANNTIGATSVLAHFNKNTNSKEAGNRELYVQKISDLEDSLDSTNRRIDRAKEDYDYFANMYNNTLIELRRFEPTQNLQKEVDELDKKIRVEEEALKKDRDALVKYFNNNAVSLFAYPLYERAKERLKEMNLDDKGVKGLEVTAINELLARGRCLCGTELNEGSIAYKNVESYKEILPPKAVGTLVREMQDKIDDMQANAVNFLDQFETLYNTIQRTLNHIDEYRRTREVKIEELRQLDKANLTQYQDDLNRYAEKRDEADTNRINAKADLKTINDQIEMYSNKVQKIDASAEKDKQAALGYMYAKRMYDWVSATYDEKEQQIRNRLNELVVTKFNAMYSGKREAKLDDKYNLVITVDGKPLSLTGGLKAIRYFAYVGALIQLATEEVESRNKNELRMGEYYPLVLDAAFSTADEKHVQSISEELIKSTPQFILAVMPKDWEFAKETIGNQVSRMYELRKISETCGEIVEVI